MMVLGGGRFLMSEVPLYCEACINTTATHAPPLRLCLSRNPYALTPNTVEPIPTLGAIPPRGGPVQDPVFTREVYYCEACTSTAATYMGTLLITKRQPPRTTVGP